MEAQFGRQASLKVGRWHGRPDILRRVDAPSDLGDWSYEPVETKLARQTKAETILQLCLYADLLEDYQGVRPARIHVIMPDTGGEPETFVVAEYIVYFRLVLKRGAAKGSQPPLQSPAQHTAGSIRLAAGNLTIFLISFRVMAIMAKSWLRTILNMKRISAKDAKYGFGRLLDTAMAQPVTIEKHGRPVAVVLSVSEYQRLVGLDEDKRMKPMDSSED